LQHETFEPSKFHSVVEVDPPTTKIYRFHGNVVHPSGERVPVGTDNLLLRECVLKNSDYVEGIVVYAGKLSIFSFNMVLFANHFNSSLLRHKYCYMPHLSQ
jgi:hypothetical protein